jgi:replication factor C subunit 2/4
MVSWTPASCVAITRPRLPANAGATTDRDLGYSSHDIISTMFRVTKTMNSLSEHAKLEFIKEIGFTHMRILEGVQTLLQLSGCVARLCRINMKPQLFEPPK